MKVFKPIITCGLLGVAMLFSVLFITPMEPITAVPLPDILPKELPLINLYIIEKDQIAYHQKLQLLDPHMYYDLNDHLWTPEAILHHKYQGNDMVKLKVLWKDATKTWENLDALFLHDPIPVVHYGILKGLLKKDSWILPAEYVEKYVQFRDMRRALKVAKTTAPTYKFGIEVPKSVLQST